MNQTYKIAHFGDVHFRGLTRHDEYRTVFTKIFAQLEKEKVDAVIIAGDIVHTKTQGISPEVIEILTWWFKSFAKIAPTYVVLGNHDGLIHNENRQDAITPIINAIDDKRLKLFKKSGNYKTHMDGIHLANYSCFDEEGWDSISKEGEIVIALYHGAVKGSLTDSDYATEGEVDLEMFEGCHYGMFADIHKQQFLDKKGKFGYCGSTIQQNFGECQDKGYLLWKISGQDKFTVSYKIVESPHPYVTVEWRGSVTQTADVCKTYAKGSRFRISSNESLLQEEIKQLASFLKEELDAHEIVWKFNVEVDRSKSQEDFVSNRKNLRDIETHKQLISSFAKDDTNIEKYTDVVGKCLLQLEEDEIDRGSQWTLNSLEWENTFSYGKGNSINFDELNGVIGIFGRNRIGKSSIPGTLMYALYNDTDRGALKNLHVINTRKGHCRVTANISVDGVPYQIERQSIKATNKRGHTSASTQLNLSKLDKDGDIIIDLTGEQRNDSEKILRNLVGTSDDFLLTSFASQGEMNTFVKMGATSRKAYLSRFLDLQILEKVSLKLKEESSSLKGLLKTLPDRNFELLKNEYLASIKECEATLSETALSVLDFEREQKTLQAHLSNSSAKKQYTQNEVNELESRLKNVEMSLETESASLVEHSMKIESIEKKISAISKIRDNFPIESLRLKLSEHTTLEKNSVQSKNVVDREKNLLKEQERSVSKLSEVPCGESFPSCKFIKDSIRDKKLIESQKLKIVELTEQFTKITREINAIGIDKVTEKMTKYEEAISRERGFVSEKISLTSKIQSAEANVVKFKNNITDSKNILNEARSNVSNSSEVETLSVHRRRLAEIETSIKQSQQLIISLTSKNAVTEEKIKNLGEEEIRLNDIKSQWSIYEKLLSAYGKDGIPMMIVANELPRINLEIAKILQATAGFTATLETDSSGSDLEVYLDYGDSKRPLELGSGMEKMLASLAIRVALINISSLPKSNMLILDEGFGALDEQNVEVCNKLLHSLKRFFKTILVISHVDAVKDAVDGFIEVTSVGPDAHVSAIDTIRNN